MEYIDKHQETLLTKRPICEETDNPHEIIIVNCSKCQIRVEGSRRELQLMGWRLFVESRLDDHCGFPVCPTHFDGEYSWEDLY